jgi:hypothetical protein
MRRIGAFPQALWGDLSVMYAEGLATVRRARRGQRGLAWRRPIIPATGHPDQTLDIHHLPPLWWLESDVSLHGSLPMKPTPPIIARIAQQGNSESDQARRQRYVTHLVTMARRRPVCHVRRVGDGGDAALSAVARICAGAASTAAGEAPLLRLPLTDVGAALLPPAPGATLPIPACQLDAYCAFGSPGLTFPAAPTSGRTRRR